ncbi:MAG: metallopeptidase family protein [Planctomycetota bacterium]
MRNEERDRFDALLEGVLQDLPGAVHAVLEEAPLIVTDEPSPELLEELVEIEGMDLDPGDPSELAGLHTGVAITDRSLEAAGELPSSVQVFRLGVIAAAGGWDSPDADERVAEQIRITILHEIGHEMGLDEDELDELGYG